MKITAGTLNLSVQLLQPQAATGANGDPAATYALVGSRRCGQVALRPTAIEGESQRVATSDLQLLLRLDTLTRQIDATWAAVFNGTTFQVVGLDTAPRDASLLLYLRGRQA